MKKNILFSALVCGIVALLASCAGSSLRSAAEALNGTCPKPVNAIATMESVSYEDKTLVVNFSIDDSSVTIDSLTSVLDIVKNEVMVRLQNSADLKDYISTCLEADAIIKHIYTGKQSGKSFTIDLVESDLQEILDGKVEAIDMSETESEAAVENAATDAVQKEENIIKQGVEANEVEAETEQ